MAEAQEIRRRKKAKASFLRTLTAFLEHDLLSVNSLLSTALIFLALLYSRDSYFPGMSAISLFIFPISWNNAMGLVALAAGVCSAANFAQERTTNNSRFILARITQKRYLSARFTSICLSTGCSLLVAFALFGLFCFIESGGIIFPSDYSQVEVQRMSQMLIDNHPFLWFLAIILIQFMFGIVLGGIGACATAFVPNRFVGYSAPFIILFAWSQACSWIGLPAWLNPLNLSKFTFESNNVAITFLIYVAAFMGMALLFFLIFYFKGGKVIRNDS